jgi:hypothetical protein
MYGSQLILWRKAKPLRTETLIYRKRKSYGVRR